MHKSGFVLFGLIVMAALLLAGCGHLEVGIETTVASAQDVGSTEVAQLPTVTATKKLATPTLQPTLTATAVSTPIPPSPTHTPLPVPPAPTETAVFTATPVPPPVIAQFSVAPQTIQPRTPIQMNWDASGDSAQICFIQNVPYDLFHECWDVTTPDTFSWEVNDRLRDDFIVELSVTRGEQTVTDSVTVHVACPISEAWWFFTPVTTECPGTEAVNTSAAIQQFEHGWMLWLEAEDVIYALFDDNTFAQFYSYQLLGDTETGDGGVTAPAGFVAPTRGFGLVWRGETQGTMDDWVRIKMGWGLAPEVGFQTQYQYRAFTKSPGIYVRDIDDKIIQLDTFQFLWSEYEN